MTLQDVINKAIADAFRAGAEWHAIVWCGQDSATVGRETTRWEQHWRYEETLRRHQRQAAEAVGRAILRLVMDKHGEQVAMFRD